MKTGSQRIANAFLLDPQNLPKVLEKLRRQGYHLIGPRLRNGAIIYDSLASVEDLPKGWTNEQQSGSYRLKKRADESLFGYASLPHSWKQYLHPAEICFWQARRNGKGFQGLPEKKGVPKYAFVGVRPCDLAAIAIQDKVFLGSSAVDTIYAQRRQNVFLLAVNCTEPGGTCFCASMKTGPKATGGFDLSLTEIAEPSRHVFLVEIGTEKGADMLSKMPARNATAADVKKAEQALAQAAERMGRQLETDGLKELLYRNYEHPRWEDAAVRCLSCANCTMVCPTCFCSTVEESTDLTGGEAQRRRRWDSCFTMDFSYIHGGSARASGKARYRQWLTHKLAAWIDQFGASGCVGCGRCVTWCPAGLDLTEETRAIRQSDGATLLEKGIQK